MKEEDAEKEKKGNKGGKIVTVNGKEEKEAVDDDDE